MPYRVLLPKRVQKQLDVLPSTVFDRVDEHIASLRYEPRPAGVVKLKGLPSSYRVRVGDYRVIYEVDDITHDVRIITVENRKDVYR